MLRVLLISPDDAASRALRQILQQHNRVVLQRNVDYYPRPANLMQILRACSPECVFLSTHSQQPFLAVLRLMETEMAGVPLVAFGPPATTEMLQSLLRAGVREYLHPFGPASVNAALERVAERRLKTTVQPCSTDHLYTFLPANAGVGASTMVLQASAVIANRMRIPTLLMDCDLSAGLLQWMLKLENSHALTEAVGRAAELDDVLWPQLVANCGRLDLLAAGKPNPSLHIDLIDLRRLLAFVRRKYRVICADLSGNLKRYSVELMAESKRIFLVTTPELLVLYLAGEKLRYLQDQELGNRTQLLLNRTGRSDILSAGQIEKLLGMPVAMSFANTYREVNRAVADGEPLAEDSCLGRQLAALARSIAGADLAPAPHQDATPPRRLWRSLFASPARALGGGQ